MGWQTSQAASADHTHLPPIFTWCPRPVPTEARWMGDGWSGNIFQTEQQWAEDHCQCIANGLPLPGVGHLLTRFC